MSVFLRDGVWYARIKDARGRWIKQRLASARSKAEAKRLSSDLESIYERQRLGLDPIVPKDGGETVREMLHWWLSTHGVTLSSYTEEAYRIGKHFPPKGELAETPVYWLTSASIETFLQEKAKTLSPASVNQLRALISRAFNYAIRLERFHGTNPITRIKARRVHKKHGDYLRADEIAKVLVHVEDIFRDLFATAIYTGLRRGELFGMRKSDIDLESGLMLVCRSHGRNTTKNGRSAILPISDDLRPYLEHALRVSKNQLVFPAPDGHRWPRDTKMPEKLRRAMIKAGMVTGYTYKCRRRKCNFFEEYPHLEERRCPVDGRALWAKANLRYMRFHDLRHTTGTLLTRGGAKSVEVQKLMRHSDPKITHNTYGHFEADYLREAINRLKATEPLPSPETHAKMADGKKCGNFVPHLSPGEHAAATGSGNR